MSLSNYFSSENKLLICAASSIEMNAFLSGAGRELCAEDMSGWRTIHFEKYSVLQTGIGKSNAAGSVAIELRNALAEKRTYSAVLNIGIAGALSSELSKGMSILSDSMILADEGTPLAGSPAWRSLEDGGFAINKFVCQRTEWWQFLSKIVDAVGPIATISTISGTAELARSYVDRSSAIAEGMEGASIALVCAHFGVDCAELRAISNICGNSNREENPWDFPAALNKLSELGASIVERHSAKTL
ncbi:MAG: futalosine hydrolase [Candidatus Obscuribacterales bacterium]|jgi:futalosine hydrolase|nr:futalosine hydrolase [Candidatus Obscuribacterales bacterium]